MMLMVAETIAAKWGSTSQGHKGMENFDWQTNKMKSRQQVEWTMTKQQNK